VTRITIRNVLNSLILEMYYELSRVHYNELEILRSNSKSDPEVLIMNGIADFLIVRMYYGINC
jgi:hypothetical protein